MKPWRQGAAMVFHSLAQNDAGGAAFALTGGLFIFVLIIGILTSIFWIWMLIDCLTSNKPAAEKIIWLLVIIFLHVLGAVIYFIMARNGRRLATTG
jgi:hypothetical protein